MRALTRPVAAPAPAPYAAADVSYAEAKSYLCSREARQMSESDLERELDRRGRALLRKLLQGHLDQRRPGEAAGPVAGADGVERSECRAHERRLETTFGTVQVERTGYARAGHDSLHPLDAALNLPPERYSLEVRRRVAVAAASRSFDEALFELSGSTAAQVPKRQAEQLVARAAADFDAFYEARQAERGRSPPEGSVVVLTFDGKGVVLHRDDLREADAQGRGEAPAGPGASVAVHASEAGREEARQAHGDGGRRLHDGAIRAQPRGVLAELDAATAGGRGPNPASVRPRPVAKRVWASVEREPLDVVAEATLEAEHRDPEHVKHWVALVDGAETQLALVEEAAAARGVDVTVILDIIHVVEYVWKAAHAFHPAGSLELACWAWTRVRRILEGRARTVAASDARCGDRRRLVARRPQAGRHVCRLPAQVCAVSALRPLPRGGLSHRPTGVIEGACRYLVRDRMELTGARWRLAGAEAVLKLRALRASGDFDAYWEFHEAREYERNHAQHYADRTPPPVTEPSEPPSPPRLRRVK